MGISTFPILCQGIVGHWDWSDFGTTDFASYAARVDAERLTILIAVDVRQMILLVVVVLELLTKI